MSRYRFGRRRVHPGVVAAALGAVLVLGAGAAHAGQRVHAPGHAAREAIAFARAQLGKPYCWGGTGSGCYDCSGLTQMAYQSAGVSIPRTSQEQWAELRHVSHPRAGDLVFFPGSDGTWAAPGHVAILVSRNRIIQAYDPQSGIIISPLGGAGAGGIVGYARPGGKS